MSDERDPFLQKLFAESSDQIPDAGFSQHVLTKVHANNRHRRMRLLLIGAMFLVLAIPFTLQFSQQMSWLSSVVAIELVETDGNAIGTMFAPINSVALPLLLALKMLQLLWRQARGVR